MNRARLALPLVVIWAIVVAFGFSRMLSYETTPGRGAAAPARGAFESFPEYRVGLPVLLLFAHPKCPCTRATIANLAVLMADVAGHVNTYVLFVRLPSTVTGWEKTDLWQSAESIPGVHVVSDAGGAIAKRFGAATSGQALLYGIDGKLLFRGGITDQRGHYGDNAGSCAILTQLHHPESRVIDVPVFGCSLFGAAAASSR